MARLRTPRPSLHVRRRLPLGVAPLSPCWWHYTLEHVRAFLQEPLHRYCRHKTEEALRHAVANLEVERPVELDYEFHIRGERKHFFAILLETSHGLGSLHAHCADCLVLFVTRFDMPKAVIVSELVPPLMKLLASVYEKKLLATEDAVLAVQHLVSVVMRRNSF